MTIYQPVYFIVAVAAGAIASVTGFGIGSLLTPTLGIEYGVKLAVAAVSIPHLLGTALRFWMIRRSVDRHVLLSFGLMSSAGSLAGAIFHSVFSSPLLGYALGAILVFAGVTGLTGVSAHMRFGGAAAWFAGALSGLLGGLVGNQGGIRSAALLGFSLSRDAFVATSTAIALMVDAARMPVYLVTQHTQMAQIWPNIIIAVSGVVLGTVVGRRTLETIPERQFRPVVSVIILVLGVALLSGLGAK